MGSNEGEIAAAERAVAAARAAGAGPGGGHPADVARALLALSIALERGDRDADALAAAREGVAVLSPAFLAKPAVHAQPMRALVAQYVALAQRLHQPPDAALLAPVADALGALTRAEDAAEDDGP